jgi:(2Fe-2S) ferredoxin
MTMLTNNKDFLVKNILENFNQDNYSVQIDQQLAVIKKNKIDTPVIFIGAGTCGYGAGAEKTINATKKYLERNNIKAQIIETGCIGLCSSEPILDIQLPNYNRISFENVTEDKVENILSSIFKLEVPQHPALGQFEIPEARSWENIKNINEHSFFKPQKRIVLKNCGIIDPINIDQYIACGGYKHI